MAIDRSRSQPAEVTSSSTMLTAMVDAAHRAPRVILWEVSFSFAMFCSSSEERSLRADQLSAR